MNGDRWLVGSVGPFVPVLPVLSVEPDASQPARAAHT